MRWTELSGVSPPPAEVAAAQPALADEARRLNQEVAGLLEKREVVSAVMADPGRRFRQRDRLAEALLTEKQLREAVAAYYATVATAMVIAADKAHAALAQRRQEVVDGLAVLGFDPHGDEWTRGLVPRHPAVRSAHVRWQELQYMSTDSTEAQANAAALADLDRRLAAEAGQ